MSLTTQPTVSTKTPSNLLRDLTQIEAFLAFVGTVQGVVIAALPVGEAQHIASGVFAGASVLAICIQKGVEALRGA